MNEESVVDSRNLVLFFVFTYGISWILWSPFVFAGLGLYEMTTVLTNLMTPAIVLAAFAPMISALIITFKQGGRAGIRKFFKRVLNVKIKPIYYVLAVIIPLFITMFAHYFTNLTGIDTLPNNLFPEDLNVPVFVIVVPYILFIAILGGGQEEFGWRGFAQNPMQERFGVLLGSLLLGVIWGVWHLPLWFMIGEGHSYYPFFAFLLYVISISVVIGILYNASGKKMVIPWIVHTIGNVAVPFFPVLFLEDVPQPGYWVWVITNLLFAIGCSIWFYRRTKHQIVKQAG